MAKGPLSKSDLLQILVEKHATNLTRKERTLLVAPPVALPPVMPAAPGYTIDRSVSTGNGHRWTVPASRLSAANIRLS